MDFHLWLLYAVSTTLGSLLPGPGSILSMNYGLTAGMRKTSAAIAGMEVALVCHISVAALGLGALLATSQTAFLVIKWLGAAYLFYLGVRLWRAPVHPESIAAKSAAQNAAAWMTGLLVNLTNPKILVFLPLMFAQFIDL